ncbi:hypothetical protein BSPWISOXPB_7439 [uncultured Gammaproteobacteria bacterium]|nr:hypothetical protein BSPWISOXPB_7439 [uncultured Gammaproteobacteria bacterium]
MPELGLVKYKLIRSKRKTLSLQIDKDGALSVRAPMRLSVKKIESFICESKSGLKQSKHRYGQQNPIKSTIKRGDIFYF